MRLQRQWVIAACFVFLSSFPVDADIAANAVVGTWLTAPGDGGQSHIEVVEQGGVYSAKIVWLELPTYPEDDEDGMGGQVRVDRRNPDKSRRKDAILGLEILQGLRYEGKGQWKDGTIYDPNNGKTYRSQMKLGDDGILAVRGFIGFSFIGRSTEWARVPEIQEGIE